MHEPTSLNIHWFTTSVSIGSQHPYIHWFTTSISIGSQHPYPLVHNIHTHWFTTSKSTGSQHPYPLVHNILYPYPFQCRGDQSSSCQWPDETSRSMGSHQKLIGQETKRCNLQFVLCPTFYHTRILEGAMRKSN